MGSPQRTKILRDILGAKARTLLIVLSIAIGVFAVGAVAHMQLIVSHDLDVSYQAVSPASFTITTEGLYSEELLDTLRKLPEVAGVSGQRRIMARFQHGNNPKLFPMELIASPDYAVITVNRIYPETTFRPDPARWQGGVWPPPDHELVIERTSLLVGHLGLVRSKLGDVLAIEMPDGETRSLKIAGLAYDFNQLPATFAGHAYAYITFDTLERLGQSRELNTIHVRIAGDSANGAHIARVADSVRRIVERSGQQVARVELYEPGKLPLDYVFRAIALILGVLGVLSLSLSSFLIINTVVALLHQQVRQIGVMKAIGARSGQLVAMYLLMVAAFGALATLLAVPLALGGTSLFTRFLSYFLNFSLSTFSAPPLVLLIEVAVGLIVPLGAALLPVLRGTNITVHEALSANGGAAPPDAGGLIALLERLPQLPRTLTMICRNTLRRRGRLILTLSALSIASATFITVVNLRVAMNRTVDRAFDLWQYDVLINLKKPYSARRIEQEARQVPGVSAVECWGEALVYRIYPDKHTSASIALIAPPAETAMLKPQLIAGRWLRPGEQHTIVIDTQVLRDNPDLAVGDRMAIEVRGRTTPLEVVGIVQTVGAARFAYMDYVAFGQLFHQERLASRLQVSTSSRDSALQSRIAHQLQDRLTGANMEVVNALSTPELREQSQTLFAIITTLLMAMALLMVAVGGLGLMGSMSLNVLERTREIGVLRAIGASTGSIVQVVVGEGLLIGFLSWAIGVLFSIPLSPPLAAAIGMQFFQTPLLSTFSLLGSGIWLLLVGLLSLGASWVPASRATQITVRDALSYES